MPVEFSTLILFVPAALALNLTPGADMLFCLGQGLKSGAKAGMAASLGISTGSMMHTVMAGVGLAVLIDTYPLAFELVRWAGVTYLIWIAIQAFRSPVRPLGPSAVRADSPLRSWRNGVFVCLLNPKVAIFMLAFVPQFIDPARGSTFVQFLVLGTIIATGGTLINGMVGVFAGTFGRILATSRRAGRAMRIVTGCLFIGLAVPLAMERR